MDKHNEQILLHIYAHCLDVESFINQYTKWSTNELF